MALALLAGCMHVPPRTVDADEAQVPERWHAPLTVEPAASVAVPKEAASAASTPATGAQAPGLDALYDWWGRWNDPALLTLIGAAEEASPTLATAAARIAQARAAVVGAQAALAPSVDAQASVSRGTYNQLPDPSLLMTTKQLGGQLQWELDLFGRLRQARSAADARLQGAQAQWHDARLTLAADTARQYFALLACQDQRDIALADARSRTDTERLTRHLAGAGFTAAANLALAEAGTAQAEAQRQEVATQCAAALKSLSALTALDASRLQERLGSARLGTAPVPNLTLVAVDRVPADVLAHRPDVYAAAQAVAAASGDVGAAEAARYPSLGLSGSIARMQVGLGGYGQASGSTWSFGPLALDLPLFDGGRRRAQAAAARTQYEAAVSQYRATVRDAVREVETALDALAGARARSQHMDQAVAGFRRQFEAAQARYRAGMGSLLDLEQARHDLLAAQTAQTRLRQETRDDAVALYRALGGGWDARMLPDTQPDRTLVAEGEARRLLAAQRRAATVSAPARTAALPGSTAAAPRLAASATGSSSASLTPSVP
ncbi:efflux transporter outer membrane subunit [Brachymonas sp. M4Q-1]|uniref:efflux transporter outer membrane subunit n=1 Tax=Brachymonas sp. M4Q-1 TaxID=3416906 RepID=UPI003CF4EC38